MSNKPNRAVQRAVVRTPCRSLDHEPDDDVVRVGVGIFRTGLEDRLRLLDVRQELDRRRRDEERPEQCVDERFLLAEVRDPAGVVQQLAQRDVLPLARQVGPPSPDRVLEAEHPARDQGQRRRTVKRLGHARQPHVVVDAKTCVGLDIRDAGADHPTIVASLDHDDDTGRAIGLRHEFGRGVLHRSLGI